jgi:hypothetical protein
MTTAQDVFDAAMGLMDEVNETTGETDTVDTKEYKNRTLFILNILRGELYPYSDGYDRDTDGARPIARIVEDFDSGLPLDDYICQTVLPYGLAAHLLLDENPSAAAFYNQRYEELKAQLSRGLPSVSEDIYDVYGGGLRYNEFSRW